MGLVLCQMARFSRHHELVKVSPWNVGSHHYYIVGSDDSFGERENVWLLCQVIVDVNLTLHVCHEVFLDNLFHTHAF